MTDRSAPPSGPRAGGFLLALAILAGAVIGTIEHQPTIGVIAGTAAGIFVAIALWLKDRRRP